MKKVILVLVLLLLVTGCTTKNIENDDINDVIVSAIEDSNHDFTESYNGFKIRIPQGFEIVGKVENNIRILNGEDVYYLYIDIIGRYYKKDVQYEEKSNVFLSRKINYDGKNGYIEIVEKDDKYYIKAEYNNAKIEALVSKKNINTGVYNIIKILSSVEYNDLIINTMIGENALTYKEEEFNLFESKQEENFFMDYIEEYDEEEELTIKDEDIIK